MERAEYKNGPPPAEFVLGLARDRDHWKQAVERLEREFNVLWAKYQSLVAFYDRHNGTPCEQVRHQEEITDLQAQLAAEADQRTSLQQSVDIANGAYESALQRADALQQQVAQLRDWQANVTAALQRPGGTLFEDVPKHIKDLVEQHTTLRGLVREIKEEFDGCTHECERCGESDPMATFDIYKTVCEAALECNLSAFDALKQARQGGIDDAVKAIRARGDEYMRDCQAKDATGKKYRDTYEMRRTNSGRAWAFKDLADDLDRLREGVEGNEVV